MHVWEAAEFQFFYGFKMRKDFRVRSNKCEIVDAESTWFKRLWIIKQHRPHELDMIGSPSYNVGFSPNTVARMFCFFSVSSWNSVYKMSNWLWLLSGLHCAIYQPCYIVLCWPIFCPHDGILWDPSFSTVVINSTVSKLQRKIHPCDCLIMTEVILFG